MLSLSWWEDQKPPCPGAAERTLCQYHCHSSEHAGSAQQAQGLGDRGTQMSSPGLSGVLPPGNTLCSTQLLPESWELPLRDRGVHSLPLDTELVDASPSQLPC